MNQADLDSAVARRPSRHWTRPAAAAPQSRSPAHSSLPSEMHIHPSSVPDSVNAKQPTLSSPTSFSSSSHSSYARQRTQIQLSPTAAAASPAIPGPRACDLMPRAASNPVTVLCLAHARNASKGLSSRGGDKPSHGVSTLRGCPLLAHSYSHASGFTTRASESERVHRVHDCLPRAATLASDREAAARYHHCSPLSTPRCAALEPYTTNNLYGAASRNLPSLPSPFSSGNQWQSRRHQWGRSESSPILSPSTSCLRALSPPPAMTLKLHQHSRGAQKSLPGDPPAPLTPLLVHPAISTSHATGALAAARAAGASVVREGLMRGRSERTVESAEEKRGGREDHGVESWSLSRPVSPILRKAGHLGFSLLHCESVSAAAAEVKRHKGGGKVSRGDGGERKRGRENDGGRVACSVALEHGVGTARAGGTSGCEQELKAATAQAGRKKGSQDTLDMAPGVVPPCNLACRGDAAPTSGNCIAAVHHCDSEDGEDDDDGDVNASDDDAGRYSSEAPILTADDSFSESLGYQACQAQDMRRSRTPAPLAARVVISEGDGGTNDEQGAALPPNPGKGMCLGERGDALAMCAGQQRLQVQYKEQQLVGVGYSHACDDDAYDKAWREGASESETASLTPGQPAGSRAQHGLTRVLSACEHRDGSTMHAAGNAARAETGLEPEMQPCTTPGSECRSHDGLPGHAGAGSHPSLHSTSAAGRQTRPAVQNGVDTGKADTAPAAAGRKRALPPHLPSSDVKCTARPPSLASDVSSERDGVAVLHGMRTPSLRLPGNEVVREGRAESRARRHGERAAASTASCSRRLGNQGCTRLRPQGKRGIKVCTYVLVLSGELVLSDVWSSFPILLCAALLLACYLAVGPE